MELADPKKKIERGLYLVIDPSMEEELLLAKLKNVLEEKVAAVQVWDNFYPGQQVLRLLEKVVDMCHAKGVPVLINNQWELLMETALDGVHFDSTPQDLAAIRQTVHRPFLAGVTCGNDLAVVRWAAREQLDYISFCSIFPSATSTSCELVTFESIVEARKLCKLTIFLAGGIKPGNLAQLASLPYDGIAVVSGVMNTETPLLAMKEYQKNLTLNKA